MWPWAPGRVLRVSWYELGTPPYQAGRRPSCPSVLVTGNDSQVGSGEEGMGPLETSCFPSPGLSLAQPKSRGRAWGSEPGEVQVMVGGVGRGSPLACS